MHEPKDFFSKGKLIKIPANTKTKIAALVMLAEKLPLNKTFTEREFNALLNKLHTFGDPATLRRALCDLRLVDRTPDGRSYCLNPERPSLEILIEQSEKSKKTIAGYSEHDLKDAAEFRDSIHAEALKRVQAIRPDIKHVIDRYSVEAYFQRIWDYPGAWYTIVAIPENEKSRKDLIDKIVRDTLSGRV